MNTAKSARTTFPRGLPEVGWHVSSYSENGGGQCVEAGQVFDQACYAVRDSRNRDHTALAFPSHDWTALLQAVTAR
ncbi:DUF397 domain-containing protein [Nocardiopsis nanhaiensis]